MDGLPPHNAKRHAHGDGVAVRPIHEKGVARAGSFWDDCGDEAVSGSSVESHSGVLALSGRDVRRDPNRDSHGLATAMGELIGTPS